MKTFIKKLLASLGALALMVNAGVAQTYAGELQVYFGESFSVPNILNVTGTSNLNGDVVVGNNLTDLVTITGTVQGGSPITFEGSTADGFETTISVTDPTADRTITVPNVTGTLVTTGDTGSVTTTMILDDTITASDIAADAVGSSEIATDAVGSAEIAASAVGTSEIADASVALGDLAGNSVDSSKVVDDSLTASDLGADSVASSEIATDAVGSAEIAADAVTASEIATDAVTTLEILNGTIDTADIGSLTTSTPLTFEGSTADANETTISVVDPTADRTITIPNITGTLITSGDTGTVTSTMVLDDTLTASDLAADSVTSSEIATDAVNSAEIAADAVGSSEIATDAVGSTEIATDAVTATEIATDAVGSAEIAADTVGASELADNSVASLNIIDASIDTADIGSLTTSTPLTFEGSTADAFESTFSFTDPTADRTITFQNASGTVAFLSDITGTNQKELINALVYDSGTGILNVLDPSGEYRATTTQGTQQSVSFSQTIVSRVTSAAATAKSVTFLLKANSTSSSNAKLTVTATDGTNTVGPTDFTVTSTGVYQSKNLDVSALALTPGSIVTVTVTPAVNSTGSDLYWKDMLLDITQS